LQKFNNNFEKYVGMEIRLQDVITMAYFANDYNTRNELDWGDTQYISVELEGTILTTKKYEESNTEDLIERIKEEQYVSQKNEKR